MKGLKANLRGEENSVQSVENKLRLNFVFAKSKTAFNFFSTNRFVTTCELEYYSRLLSSKRGTKEMKHRVSATNS